jgi:hypothetical protein
MKPKLGPKAAALATYHRERNLDPYFQVCAFINARLIHHSASKKESKFCIPTVWVKALLLIEIAIHFTGGGLIMFHCGHVHIIACLYNEVLT